jgi:hypothetical protein
MQSLGTSRIPFTLVETSAHRFLHSYNEAIALTKAWQDQVWQASALEGVAVALAIQATLPKGAQGAVGANAFFSLLPELIFSPCCSDHLRNFLLEAILPTPPKQFPTSLPSSPPFPTASLKRPPSTRKCSLPSTDLPTLLHPIPTALTLSSTSKPASAAPTSSSPSTRVMAQ